MNLVTVVGIGRDMGGSGEEKCREIGGGNVDFSPELMDFFLYLHFQNLEEKKQIP